MAPQIPSKSVGNPYGIVVEASKPATPNAKAIGAAAKAPDNKASPAPAGTLQRLEALFTPSPATQKKFHDDVQWVEDHSGITKASREISKASQEISKAKDQFVKEHPVAAARLAKAGQFIAAGLVAPGYPHSSSVGADVSHALSHVDWGQMGASIKSHLKDFGKPGAMPGHQLDFDRPLYKRQLNSLDIKLDPYLEAPKVGTYLNSVTEGEKKKNPDKK